MLEITKEGQIQYNIDHLVESPPDSIEAIVERYKTFDTSLFYHIVSSPACRYETGYGTGRVPAELAALSAKDRFKNILKSKSLIGNPKSYFVNKHKSSLNPSQVDEIKSVSFTLSDNKSLCSHFKARGSEYGICFFHDFLGASGIRQVVYLNEQDSADRQKMIFNAPYLVESYGKTYDMRWEKEWRIKSRLSFTKADIAFLIVPDSEYKEISAWMWDSGELNDDYVLLPSSIYTDVIKYLFMVPKLDHSKWGQISVCGSPKMDFDIFTFPTSEERQSLLSACGDYLECLCKVDIRDIYEYKFTRRFLNFVDSLEEDFKSLPIFERNKNIEGNSKEPWCSSREFVIEAYEALFNIQKDRITASW
jgi:hypothetical protein